ncbi:RNA binding protein Nrd1 [Trichophyton tonsurans CBS 112818]|uniref:RNA binding protein Nrd1 n=1 Tax=Trichophyton tonsurans (strain CBS 112818) TaxID=647933 RepID=F2RMU3_TRIT1|nr:RNA binding protein Nrd1 [Trichophyton tonsurans CBS 112818]
MSSAVAELDGYLHSMLSLKPPGVSGSKINGITSLCTANVQSESVLIQKIYTHFKRAPGTHKLGVLYVVDSVTRQWVELARKAGQQIGGSAPDGTYAAGVNRVTELLPVLMTDIINNAPEDQKSAPAAPAAGAAVPDTSSILKALAEMAKQNTAAPVAPTVPATQTNTSNVLNAQAAPPVDQTALQSNGQSVNPFAGNLASQFPGLANTAQNMFQNQPQGQAAGAGAGAGAYPGQNPLAQLIQQQQPQQQQPAAPTPVTPDPLQQLNLIQLLAAQGIPQEQWATALQILNLSNAANAGGMGNMNPAALAAFGQMPAANQNAWGANAQQPENPSRDRDRDTRSPPGQYRRRSRSPGWDRRRDVSPPRRRDSPVYGEYHGDSPGRSRGEHGRGGRRGNEYRQRSPPGRRRRSPSPRKESNLPPPGPKFIDYDYSIGDGNIKVQTCIVNNDKRHAFVKMVNRRDAMNAREGMEQYKSGDMQLRTRWGVGFGPRDCSDYHTGVSIIPVDRLTEADRKWLLTAEYGGTGGKPIENGMVVEEPDIEIGAGVSSKAISRRMATDQGGKRGPQSSRYSHERFRRNERGGGGGGGGGAGGSGGDDSHNSGSGSGSGDHDRDRDRDSASGPNANAIGVPPAVPGFGFSFPGMPMFPPGFILPGTQTSTTGAPSQPNAQGQ